MKMSAINSSQKLLSAGEAKYSQGTEEFIVRDFFQDKTDGFFVDIGAGDPIKNNNTYYLENRLRWSGIGVDALPQYEEAYKKTRHNTKFRNFIVTDHHGTVDNFYRVVNFEELSSTDPNYMPFGKQLNSVKIRVYSITLDLLLEMEQVTAIDFLTIDIEVSTLVALSNLDIKRYCPKLVCIETGNRNRPEYQKIISYFENNGYERTPDYIEFNLPNTWFTPVRNTANS
jgi:hypothetical protein